jgi:hypothetical protein
MNGRFRAATRLAAMPNSLRPILLAVFLALAAWGVAGCGSDSGPSPSIPADQAAILTSKINEIESNVTVGSCLVAADKTDELIADIQNLPSSVNQQVRQALDSGANNLKLLLVNPDKCQHTTTQATTTSTPSTTESTTTTPTETKPRTETVPNVTTTPTQTQTTPTPTTGGSGGIGPGGL